MVVCGVEMVAELFCRNSVDATAYFDVSMPTTWFKTASPFEEPADSLEYTPEVEQKQIKKQINAVNAKMLRDLCLKHIFLPHIFTCHTSSSNNNRLKLILFLKRFII
jgi:hypothetical protein